MKIAPLEPKWIDPSALELFKAVQAERNRVIEQMRIDLGDALPTTPVTATEASAYDYIRRNLKRRAEVEASYRPLLEGLAKQMADIMSRYTVPQALIVKDDPKEA